MGKRKNNNKNFATQHSVDQVVKSICDIMRRGTLADSELSWTVDLDERKKSAAVEARPFKEGATKKFQEAAQWKERLKELKKAKPKDEQAIEEAEAKVKALTRESKSLANKAKEIENAVYDLKAVNPNKKPVIDTRTPEELLGIIEAKGREVADALAVLRNITSQD